MSAPATAPPATNVTQPVKVPVQARLEVETVYRDVLEEGVTRTVLKILLDEMVSLCIILLASTGILLLVCFLTLATPVGQVR